MMGNYHVRFGGRERRVLIEARASRPNADVGAGLVCADLGLPNEIHDSHASYLASWLSVLKADKTAIITAAAHADRAWQLLRSYSAAEAAETAEADPVRRAA